MRNLTPSSLILYIFFIDQTPSMQPISVAGTTPCFSVLMPPLLCSGSDTTCQAIVATVLWTTPYISHCSHKTPGPCHFRRAPHPTQALTPALDSCLCRFLHPLPHPVVALLTCLLPHTLCKAVLLCKNASSPFFFQSTKKYGTFSINRLNVFWCKQSFNSSNTIRKIHILMWISHGLPSLYATLKPSVLVSPPSVVWKIWPWNTSRGLQIIFEKWHSVSHF